MATAGVMLVCSLYFSTRLLDADLFGGGELGLDNVMLSWQRDGSVLSSKGDKGNKQ